MIERASIWDRLDAIGKCTGCPRIRHYCAPYVGPDYESSEPRILCVGLDHGEKRTLSAVERRDSVIDWWETHPLKDHYRGCIWVASELLHTRCRLDCENGCVKKTSALSDCALRRFAQTNAVRCVGEDQTDMTCRSQSRVGGCIPLVFEDIRILNPKVIVLQGRNHHTGHLQKSFLEQAKDHGAKFEGDLTHGGAAIIDLIIDGQKIVVASFRHPSRGWLKRDWENVICPVLHEINDRLSFELIPLPR